MTGYIFLLVCLVQCSFGARTAKNVCRTFTDYKYLETSPNCWYDPDLNSHPKNISEHYGFQFDSYEVKTEDAFVLGLFRVRSREKNEGSPVLLAHGMIADSSIFFALGSDSLPFVLARNGSDVWLVNFRASHYSSRHLKYDTGNKNYWNFSFHEMGIYDLPAIIDFISEITNHKRRIIYLGHSMGTTAAFVYASYKNNEAFAKLKAIIALAPVAYLSHTRAIIRLAVPFTQIIKDYFNSRNIYGISDEIDLRLCDRFPGNILCFIVYTLLNGINEDEIIVERAPYLTRNLIRGLSLKTLEHYSQLLGTDEFKNFDYGTAENSRIYNSQTPPEYLLSNIKVPIYLFYGTKDFLADEQDVLKLYHQLNAGKLLRKINFSHGDFLNGRTAPNLYKALVKMFQ